MDEFWEIVDYIKDHISPSATFEYYDTICRQVANRMPNLRTFAASHDLIFFVSGKKSSNGKMLFSECLKVNPNSHLIDTSPPKWLMEQIYTEIKARLDKKII